MIKKEENGKGNGVTYVPSSHNTKPKLSQGVVTPICADYATGVTILAVSSWLHQKFVSGPVTTTYEFDFFDSALFCDPYSSHEKLSLRLCDPVTTLPSESVKS